MPKKTPAILEDSRGIDRRELLDDFRFGLQRQLLFAFDQSSQLGAIMLSRPQGFT